jgi:DNA-binding MarR family transcriptional regulator
VDVFDHTTARSGAAGGTTAMVASNIRIPVEELAQSLFDTAARFCLTSPRGRRRHGDLKELEFLALTVLQQRGPLIVGDIQRHLGVLPAQMSRIIRSLEARERPLISCRINPQDKRKIDVALTPAGVRALQEYQAARVRALTDLLARLPEDDADRLHRLLGTVADLLGTAPAS